MRTNLLITFFILSLIVLAVYVYAVYPLADGDRINQQQLANQLAVQKGRYNETQQRFPGLKRGEELLTTDNLDSIENEIIPELTVVVSIKNNQFIPSNITIVKGTTVVWENDDVGFHLVSQAIEKNPKILEDSLESTTMRPGDKFSFTFNSTGIFDYHCDYNSAMRGRIKVVD